jgi:hypothetical protein
MSNEITEKDKGIHPGYDTVEFFNRIYAPKDSTEERLKKLEGSWWNKWFR